MLTPGEKIRKKRKALGLSAEQLATRSNVSNKQIYLLETNNLRPNLITMLKLCKYLKVDLRIFDCSLKVAEAIKCDRNCDTKKGGVKRIPGRHYKDTVKHKKSPD